MSRLVRFTLFLAALSFGCALAQVHQLSGPSDVRAETSPYETPSAAQLRDLPAESWSANVGGLHLRYHRVSLEGFSSLGYFGFWVDAGIDAPLTMSLEHHIAGSLAEVEAGVAVDFGRDAFTLKLATQRLRDISRAALDAAFTEADVDLIHTKRYHVEGDAVGRGFT